MKAILSFFFAIENIVYKDTIAYYIQSGIQIQCSFGIRKATTIGKKNGKATTDNDFSSQASDCDIQLTLNRRIRTTTHQHTTGEHKIEKIKIKVKCYRWGSGAC